MRFWLCLRVPLPFGLYYNLTQYLSRCADKILTQLEMHARAELYFGGGGSDDEDDDLLDSNANSTPNPPPPPPSNGVLVRRRPRGRSHRPLGGRNASSWSEGCDDSAIAALFIGNETKVSEDEGDAEEKTSNRNKRKSVTFAEC